MSLEAGDPEVIEKKGETRVIVHLGSVSKEDINLYLNGDLLVMQIKGLGSRTIKLKNRDYDTSNARASFKNGVLEVRLPIRG